MPAHERAAILTRVSEGISGQTEVLARIIAEEVRKPISDARREAARAAFTFRWAAGEALRFGGEVQPLDLEPGSEGRLALTRRFPKGPALLISPFNFPLNLAAHKVAPAMAVGAPFVLKPASCARKTAAELLRLVLAAGWPAEAAAVADLSGAEAEALVQDERFAVVSFTGSPAVGWRIKSLAGRKSVLLELGGNAGVFVGEDADLDRAAARCAWGAYCYSGQVCISVQRIYAARSVYRAFRDKLLAEIAKLRVGGPMDGATVVGPLITEAAAERVEAWVREAEAAGGKLLCGGSRAGDLMPPILIEDAPAGCRVNCEEAFGPVACISAVDSAEQALRAIADSRYGLQAGIFTRDMGVILRFWEELPVGGVIVDDVPTFRCDAMPYGGVKDSGLGREGVRWAMEELSDIRTLVLRH
ncbi:MAG: aldehyde dehydrogenase family protein [Elusimicrobiota bacterium]|jgi:aldehyde dehydrogenase (NAD+)